MLPLKNVNLACVFYPKPTKNNEFINHNNNQSNNFLSDNASLILVRCNFWSSVGRKFADLVSKGFVNDEGCDIFFEDEFKNDTKNYRNTTNRVGIQIHFILVNHKDGYCKVLYTKKVISFILDRVF